MGSRLTAMAAGAMARGGLSGQRRRLGSRGAHGRPAVSGTAAGGVVERAKRREAETFAMERDRSMPHLAASLLVAAAVAGLGVAMILGTLPILALVGLSWLIGRHLRHSAAHGERQRRRSPGGGERWKPSASPIHVSKRRPLSRRTTVGAGR